MKKYLFGFIVLFASAFVHGAADKSAGGAASEDLFPSAGAGSKAVYQTDDRLDLWEVKNPWLRALADSTVAIVASWKLSPDGDRVAIRAVPHGEGMNLCRGEPFRDQPSAADCSGFLAGPDIVVTAAHCAASPITCRAHKFIFGFAITAKGEAAPDGVPASEVYSCGELLGARFHGGNLTDWAVVRLDRPVPNHRPLELDREPPALGLPVLIVGHPDGLPEKFAGNARITDIGHPEYFLTDLDAFGGNSGSPVFNALSGRVAGVLVRGEEDYITVAMPDGTECNKTKRCLNGECSGEAVTRVSEFWHLVPEINGN